MSKNFRNSLKDFVPKRNTISVNLVIKIISHVKRPYKIKLLYTPVRVRYTFDFYIIVKSGNISIFMYFE